MNEDQVVSQDTVPASVESDNQPVDGGISNTESTADTQQASRTYTDAQVQEIVRKRAEQQKRSYERRLSEFQQKQTQYESMVGRMNQGIEAMGRGFGFIQDKTPENVTPEHLTRLQQQFEEQLNQRFQKVEEERLFNAIQNDWQGVTQKYAEWADMPGFKDAWAKQWKPGQDAASVAAKMVEAYEKKFAARANQSAATKENRLKSAPVRPGGGTASPQKADESVPLSKGILGALRAARGG